MPGTKQKITEMVFGRELSDGGEIDGRRRKHSILLPFILFFSIGGVFSYVSLIPFPHLLLLSSSVSHLLRFKYTVLENIGPAFYLQKCVEEIRV